MAHERLAQAIEGGGGGPAITHLNLRCRHRPAAVDWRRLLRRPVLWPCCALQTFAPPGGVSHHSDPQSTNRRGAASPQSEEDGQARAATRPTRTGASRLARRCCALDPCMRVSTAALAGMARAGRPRAAVLLLLGVAACAVGAAAEPRTLSCPPSIIESVVSCTGDGSVSAGARLRRRGGWAAVRGQRRRCRPAV